MKKISLLLIMLFAVVCLPSMGFAASPWMDKPTYNEKMTGKLKFGAKNLLLGWTKLISMPVHEIDEKSGNKVANGFVGFGKGLGYGLVDTVGGALHLVTFPITNLDVPLPDNGVHVECLSECPRKNK